MLIEALRLCVALNSVAAGVTNLPEAEHALTAPRATSDVPTSEGPTDGGLIMHVHDPGGLLGVPEQAATLRVGLTRAIRSSTGAWGAQHPADQTGSSALSRPDPPAWALALPRHGRAGGLRGPRALTAAALELANPIAAVAVPHHGGAAWLPRLLGAPTTEAVQWQVLAAEPIELAATPAEAITMFAAALAAATHDLTRLDITAGQRPERTFSVRLGPAYPQRSQVLLDRALVVLAASWAALDSSAEVVHSHAVLTREQVHRGLIDVCCDTIQACVSWPSHALH